MSQSSESQSPEFQQVRDEPGLEYNTGWRDGYARAGHNRFYEGVKHGQANAASSYLQMINCQNVLIHNQAHFWGSLFRSQAQSWGCRCNCNNDMRSLFTTMSHIQRHVQTLCQRQSAASAATNRQQNATPIATQTDMAAKMTPDPCEKEKQRAQDLADQLEILEKKWQGGLLKRKVQRLKFQHTEELKKAQEDLAKSKLETEDQKTQFEVERNAFKTNLNIKQEALQEAQGQVRPMRDQLQEAQKEKNSINNRLETMTKEKNDLISENSRLQNEVLKLRNAAKDIVPKTMKQLNDRHALDGQKLRTAEKALETAKKAAQEKVAEDKKQAAIREEKHQMRCEKEKAALEENVRKQARQYENKIKALEKRIKEMEGLKGLEKTTEWRRVKIEEQNERIKQLKKDTKELEEEMDDYATAIGDNEMRLKEKDEEIEQLTSLNREYENMLMRKNEEIKKLEENETHV